MVRVHEGPHGGLYTITESGKKRRLTEAEKREHEIRSRRVKSTRWSSHRTPRKYTLSQEYSRAGTPRQYTPTGRFRALSSTLGWREEAPSRGPERHRMRGRCGDKCFLDPESEGYPVCAAGTCKVSCQGALAALRRAAQYHRRPDIEEKAREVARKAGCGWVTKSGRRLSRERSERRRSRERR